MKALNNDLIDKVMAKIKKDPETWSQANWICETTACFAGHALLESELYEVRVDRHGDCPYDTPGCQCGVIVSVVNRDGVVVSVQQEARELLGFTYQEANRVFLDTHTDLAAMTDVISDIRAGRAQIQES